MQQLSGQPQMSPAHSRGMHEVQFYNPHPPSPIRAVRLYQTPCLFDLQ